MEEHDVQPEEGPQVSVLSFMYAEAGHGPRGRLGKRTFSQQKDFVDEAATFRQGYRSGDGPTARADFGTVTRLNLPAMESLPFGESVSLTPAGWP